MIGSSGKVPRTQLTASRHDIQSFAVTYDGRKMLFHQNLKEGLNAFFIGSLKFAAGVWVEGDEIDFGF